MEALTFVLYGTAVIDRSSHQQAEYQRKHSAMSHEQSTTIYSVRRAFLGTLIGTRVRG